MLAAGDTFRARPLTAPSIGASVIMGPVVAQHTGGGDSASVILWLPSSPLKPKALTIVIAAYGGRYKNKARFDEPSYQKVRSMSENTWMNNAPQWSHVGFGRWHWSKIAHPVRLSCFRSVGTVSGITLTNWMEPPKAVYIFAIRSHLEFLYVSIGVERWAGWWLRPLVAQGIVEPCLIVKSAIQILSFFLNLRMSN